MVLHRKGDFFPWLQKPFQTLSVLRSSQEQAHTVLPDPNRDVKGYGVSQILHDTAGHSTCTVFLHPPSPPPSYPRSRDIIQVAGHHGPKDSMPVPVSQDKTMTTSLRQCWGEREGQEMQGCGSVVFPSEMLLTLGLLVPGVHYQPDSELAGIL